VPRYNEFYWASYANKDAALIAGEGLYGIKSPLALSAEPMSSTAINYSQIFVSWAVPYGTSGDDYSAFRIVRSQNGFPQTQEDGYILYQSVGHPSQTSLTDTSDTYPLVDGRFVFYRAWVQKSTGSSWVPAGSTYTLMASPHNLGIGRDAAYTTKILSGSKSADGLAYFADGINPTVSSTHDRFMSMLPRAITSTSGSGVDVRNDSYVSDKNNPLYEPTGKDENTLLSAFLSAFSFTLDEMLTFSKLITPSAFSHWSSPAAVQLGSHELGFSQDIEPVTATQRRLLRNAIPIYSTKGTYAGLKLLSQSMTSYVTTVSNTRNLMLSYEDASFDIPSWQDDATYASLQSPKQSNPAIGNWVSLSSNLSMSVISDQAGDNSLFSDTANGNYVIDKAYSLKVTQSTTGNSFAFGILDPVGLGIPVTAGLPYSLSFYAKEGTGGATKTAAIEFRWFDRNGLLVGTSSGTVTISGTSWTKYSVTNKTAPLATSTAAAAFYMGFSITLSSQTATHFDLFQVEQGTSATNYQEPRGAVITLDPAKINYIKNPSFTGGTTGWTTDANGSLSQASSGGLFAAQALTVARGGSGSQYLKTIYGATLPTYSLPVTGDQDYSASMYVKDVNSSAQYTLSIKFYDANGFAITMPTNTPALVPATVNATTWTRITRIDRAPITAASAQITLSSATTVATGTSILVDAAMFENTSQTTDYFDGYQASDGAMWKSTTGLSYSGLYPAKSNRLERFVKEVKEYLGIGTPYYVVLYDGTIYKKNYDQSTSMGFA
jgi:hypothetical protein